MARPMQLLPQGIKAQIPKLYSQEKNSDPTVLLKFFSIRSSHRWYVIEGQDEDGDFMMFTYLTGADEDELGYTSFNELASIGKNVGGRFLHFIERDMYWKPTPLSKIKSGEVY